MKDIIINANDFRRIKILMIIACMYIYLLPAIYILFYANYVLRWAKPGNRDMDIFTYPSDIYFFITFLATVFIGIIVQYIYSRLRLCGKTKMKIQVNGDKIRPNRSA